MSPHIELFENFDNKETRTIFMGNNHSYSIKGICHISFKIHDNNVRILTHVRYVPGLKRNLISLGTLDELGYAYKAKNGFLHVFKNDKLILSRTKKHGLYVLNGYSLYPVSSACIAKSDRTKL